MKEEDYKEIKGIHLISDIGEKFGFSMDKWEFTPCWENGEMAALRWIMVYKNDKKVAYLRQSDCTIYFK